MRNKLAIAATEKDHPDIIDWARQLSAPIVDIHDQSHAYLLVKTPQRVELHFPAQPHLKPYFVDYTHGKFGYRRARAAGRNELIAKAVGIKGNYYPFVLDATAGLGRDGLLLANSGCPVILLERSFVLYLLVRDGLQRLHTNRDESTHKLQLQLRHQDAIGYLTNLPDSEKPDVVYLDPMFPERAKTAKIKKEMQILQDLIGETADAETLFALALQKAKRRVVVKRPLHAEPLAGRKADLVYQGKSIRFDVYLIRNRLDNA